MLIGPFSVTYLKNLIKKLIGNNEIEDALKRLDRLTQEEAQMASAQLLPPDLSKNHYNACNARHKERQPGGFSKEGCIRNGSQWVPPRPQSHSAT